MPAHLLLSAPLTHLKRIHEVVLLFYPIMLHISRLDQLGSSCAAPLNSYKKLRREIDGQTLICDDSDRIDLLKSTRQLITAPTALAAVMFQLGKTQIQEAFA
jgi:hypothetical protein